MSALPLGGTEELMREGRRRSALPLRVEGAWLGGEERDREVSCLACVWM